MKVAVEQVQVAIKQVEINMEEECKENEGGEAESYIEFTPTFENSIKTPRPGILHDYDISSI